MSSSAASNSKVVLNSIRQRLIVASLVCLPAFCGVLAWSLDRAFQASLLQNEEEKMQLHVYTLIAAADYEDGKIAFPESFSETRFNQPSSGLFATLVERGNSEQLWVSASATGVEGLSRRQVLESDLGQLLFTEIPLNGLDYFIAQYAFAWEGEQKTNEFILTIFKQKDGVNAQLSAYRRNMWTWLLGVAIVIIAVQLLILRWGLKPIETVVSDLRLMRDGKKNALQGQYPKELKLLTASINSLVAQEQEQKSRYRNTMSDLAHSIKTPLAILQGEASRMSASAAEPSLEGERIQTENYSSSILEQTQRINDIVTYQLNRSVLSGKSVFSTPYSVEQCCDELMSAMTKVYSDKAATISLQVEPALKFMGEKGDFMEVLGNLLDNAYKYGATLIQINAELSDKNKLVLRVDDDGPGLVGEELNAVLKRGQRADTSVSGQGLGLSIVSDIVSSYGGSIKLSDSHLGGLCVAVVL